MVDTSLPLVTITCLGDIIHKLKHNIIIMMIMIIIIIIIIITIIIII